MNNIHRLRLISFLVILSISLLISACSKPVETTVAPTANIATQAPSTPEPLFPLSGKWSGVAVNGSTQMDAIIEFNTACEVGEVCGSFNLLTIPCAGSYTLQSVAEDQYQFAAGDYIGSCAESQDVIYLNPDGTLQYISRGVFGETRGTLSRITPIPVIYDDDGSPDGAIALVYFLSDPRVSLKAVTISYGEAYPTKYIQFIGGLLDGFGVSGIPLGAGKSEPLGGDNAFPEWMRENANNFWNQPKPDTGKAYAVSDAARLMVDTLNNSPEPITLFISGPCTNLAEALRLDPGIKDHIQAVFIMGGALYVPGNLTDVVQDPENAAAEWNIYADPLAASEVFNSGLDIYLVPLDATQFVTVSHSDTKMWRSGGPAADFAANFYDQQISGVGSEAFYCWDATTAEILVNPSLCEFTPLHVDVGTEDGQADGQTQVMDSGQPNINACLQPDVQNLVNTLNSLLAASN